MRRDYSGDVDYDFRFPQKVASPSNRFERRRTIQTGIETFHVAFIEAAEQLAQDMGDRVLEQVRTEYVRPQTGKGFTDRSGDLRGSLQAVVTFDGTNVKLRLVAAMVYASFVERIKDGTYAYLGPSLRDTLPELRQMAIRAMQAPVVASRVRGYSGRTRISDLIEKGRQAEAAASVAVP